MSLILAIDDKLDNLITVKALLKLFIPDCNVIIADSGAKGIEMAIDHRPDTILLDIHMPGMDGFEVCLQLKTNPRTARIPVVMLTAIRTDSKSRVKALELGADAFLTKPIDETELAAQVKAMLRIKQAEDKLRNEKELLEELVAQRVKDLSFANKQLLIEMEEREKAQTELEMTSKALENSLNGFDIVNDQGLFIYVNKAYVSMWGYDSADEILGTSPANHCLDPTVPEKLIQTLKKKKECKFELTAKRKDGSTFEVLMYARMAYDENGREIYPTSSIDITEQKTAQIERERLEKQLIQAQKMEAVGALAGGIAHDFNNILYPIIGFSELLKEDMPADSPMMDSAQEIFTAANRARDLVKQILTFSRQMDQEIKPIKVQPILKEVISLSHSIIPKTIAINDDINRACRPILADPTQIHQMIMNLVTNAFHAMENEGGVLDIQLVPTTIESVIFKNKRMVPGDYICLSVEDSGIGISKEIIHNIFDPYFTTKGVDKGTGLGLSVVHGIVKNTRGEIFVESQPGQGTRFEIYLPVMEEKRADISFKPTSHPKGDEHILLVDDEAHVTNIETQMLERLGYRVTCINDPEKALTLFSDTPEAYDMMISDLTMPGMTGDQLSRAILAQKPDFPIIICTGYSELLNEDQVKRIGVKALLMKPIVLSDLAQTVRSVLDS